MTATCCVDCSGVLLKLAAEYRERRGLAVEEMETGLSGICKDLQDMEAYRVPISKLK